MKQVFSRLIATLKAPGMADLGVLTSASPIPFFGRFAQSRVATVGLNPSNREFVDSEGRELCGGDRRFHTLESLGLSKWEHATDEHLTSLISACTEYFDRNPYTGWFGKLETILQVCGHSYFGRKASACHLDLVPFATGQKWGRLENQHRNQLLKNSSGIIGALLRDSRIEECILNGASVVRVMEELTNTKLRARVIKGWRLARGKEQFVDGTAFTGEFRELGGISLGRTVRVVGYNHNIQSSFGVSRSVHSSIADWIAERFVSGALQ